MSALFFLLAALLVVVALVVVAPPLFSARKVDAAAAAAEAEAARRRQNIAAARRRMRELRARWERGELAADDYGEARAEIERALLDDLAAEGEARVARAGETTAGTGDDFEKENGRASGLRGKWAAAFFCALLPAGAGALYLHLGEPRAIAGAAAAGVARLDGDGGGAGATMAAAIGALRERLAAEPEDARGWVLLARSLATTGRFGEAAGAFARARALAGDSPELLTGEAEARARAAGGDFSGEAGRLLARALELAPEHPGALWLSGLAAMNRGAHREAAAFWRRALPAVDDAKAAEQLRELIARAEAESGAGAPTVVEDGDDAAAASGGSRSAVSPSTVHGITVEVSLSPELSAGAERVVFVFARAAAGPRIPLAAARRRAGELPLTLTLTDAMAMTPALKLSQFAEVDVVARISQSGTPQPAPGDLFGEVKGVPTVGGGTIALVINRRTE